MIRGGCSDVSKTKCVVKQKYEKFFRFQTIHLHHESEHYEKVVKLIAHKKIVAYKQLIMSLGNTIPINHIADIVSYAVNRALSKESITQLCFEANIKESGDVSSGPYKCWSSFTIKRLTTELIEKTLESVSGCLGSIICAEMQKHIVWDTKIKFNFDLNPFIKLLDIPKLFQFQSVFIALTTIFSPCAGIYIVVVNVVAGTFTIAVNVNSEAWRRDVATEIYENVSEHRQEIVQEITSNMLRRCKITKDELDNIVEILETFQRRIDLSDQVLREYLLIAFVNNIVTVCNLSFCFYFRRTLLNLNQSQIRTQNS